MANVTGVSRSWSSLFNCEVHPFTERSLIYSNRLSRLRIGKILRSRREVTRRRGWPISEILCVPLIPSFFCTQDSRSTCPELSCRKGRLPSRTTTAQVSLVITGPRAQVPTQVRTPVLCQAFRTVRATAARGSAAGPSNRYQPPRPSHPDSRKEAPVSVPVRAGRS
jgi:hypothetical protein